MDIMSFFKGAGQQQQQQPAPQQSSNQNPPVSKEPAFQQSENQDPKSIDQQTGDAGDPGTFSLDNLQSLFDTDDKEAGNSDPIADDFFTYDPTRLDENVKQMQFINPEQMEELGSKALQGDQQALGKLLNGLAQTVYSKAAELSIGVSNRTAKSSLERAQEQLPDRMRSLMARENLSEINPQFKNRALEPLVNMAKTQFETKYPDASPKEIAKMVNNYMSVAAKALSSPEDQTGRPPEESSQKQTDFSKFFNPRG